MTVSRVVNGDVRVRDITRAKVADAIAALNYAPNKAAQLLAGAANCRIALIYGNPSSAYLSEVLVGCLADSGRTHVQLLLEKLDETETSEEVVCRLVAAGIDALILPPPYCDNGELIAAIHRKGMVVASLASGEPVKDAIALAIDDRLAAQNMTEHLISLGHRRIGFIVGNRNQTASAHRLAGYRTALTEAGIAEQAELIWQGDFSYRSGLAAASALLDLPQPPTAIFASNDDMAAAVIAVAHQRHLEVPRDLSVCGYDDTALATTIMPELTTVRQPVAEMAQASVKLLVEAVKRRRSGDRFDPVHKIFPHAIVQRQSADRVEPCQTG